MRCDLGWLKSLIFFWFSGCLAEFPAPPAAGDAARFDADAPTDAARPIDGRVDAAPRVDAALVDAAPRVDAAPVDAAPVDAAPVDAAPVDAAPVDAAPRVDAAPVDAAPPVDGSDIFACAARACVTLIGEVATSACLQAPLFACDPSRHELCQCGNRSGGLYFDAPPGSGRPARVVTYVYQPAEADSPHVRLSINNPMTSCLAPEPSCDGVGACAGHRALTWHLAEPLQGPVRLQLFHHPTCRDPAGLARELVLNW